VPGVLKTAYGSPVYAIDEESRYGLEADAVQNYLLVTIISVLTIRLDILVSSQLERYFRHCTCDAARQTSALSKKFALFKTKKMQYRRTRMRNEGHKFITHIFFGGLRTASCVVAKNPTCRRLLAVATLRTTFSASLKLKSSLTVYRHLAMPRQLARRPVDKPLAVRSHL